MGEPSDATGVSSRWLWVGLAFVTAVAAALRLPFLNHQSLWFDEIYTRSILGEPSLAGVWRHVEATESTPPLFYVIGWLLGARSAAAMRLVPALSLTAAAPVAYFALRRMVGQRAALASAAVVAVSPMLVSYGTDARSYGLLVLLSLLSVWAFTAVLEEPSWRRYGAWTAACALCVWTHYFGGFVVAGEALLLLALCPQTRRRTVACSLAIVALIAPLLPMLAHQSSSERAEFISEIHLGSRLETTVRQFAMGPNVPRTWLEGAGLAIWALALAWGAWHALRERSGPGVLLALAAFSLGVPLLLSASGAVDRFYARNVIFALPLAIGLAAPAMLRLRGLPLGAYLALATLASVWVATDWRYEQLDWRDALARAEQVEPSAPVFAVTKYSAPVVATYLGRALAPAAGLRADEAWVIVEPDRPAGHRWLTPAPVPALAGFTSAGTIESYGFRIELMHAARPVSLSSSSLPGAVLFPGS